MTVAEQQDRDSHGEAKAVEKIIQWAQHEMNVPPDIAFTDELQMTTVIWGLYRKRLTEHIEHAAGTTTRNVIDEGDVQAGWDNDALLKQMQIAEGVMRVD